MKFDLDKVFNSLKKVSPALIAVFVTSGFAIFAPEFILTKIGIQGLSLTARQIIGGVFILSCSLVIMIISFSIIDYFKSRFIEKKTLKTLENRLKLLSHDELIRVLMMFHLSGNIISMSIQDGITGALEQKNIIVRTTPVSDDVGLLTFQYMLQPWVVKYMNAHRNEYEITFEEIEKEYKNYMNKLSNWY